MTRIVIDFETYYDKDYSLKKMTMEQYIRDLRFECIGLSIKVGDQLTQFFRAETWIPELKQLLIAYKDHTIVSHNAMFDMGILGIRYGIHPRSLGDTVAMSAVVGLDRCAGRSNLDGLSAYLRTIGYNIPTKGDYVQNMEGVRIADMSPTDWAQYSEYCKTDSDICAAMYDIMLPYMPPGELQMISATIKMFTNPSVKLDTELLEDYQQRLIQKREDLLAGVARKVGLAGADELAPHLRSTVKFAKLLESIGVTVPTKYSEKQDKMIPAVAKTDHEFLELVASDDELTRTLCEARLGAASNLEMTRCKRFIDISKRGLMPVPLRYAAAHTGRYGGADKINCFSAGHELLTPDGWVAVEHYTEGTPIAQWHEDATISFDHNPSWLAEPYKGLMYHIETPTVSLVVTPDHRISSVKQGKLEKGFTVKTAEQIANCSGLDYIPLCGVVDTPEHPYMDAQIRYLVALQADGTIVKNRHIFGFRRERKINRMNELLVELGFTFTRVLQANGTTLFTVTPPPEFAVGNKNFGSWILNLSARQLGLFIDELRYWDGNRNSNNGSLEYNSTVKDNVLWADTAMRLCGRFSGIYGYSYKNHTTGKDAPYCWRLYERTSKYGSIDTKRHITTREFDGIVYCPKVDSDRILVRHNNKICVVNQCQNLPKRKGDKSLRRSMTAPNDHVLIATDSSQIECLTGDSLVLTDTGLKRIDNISIADLLWDGVEWVRHDGVVLKGVKDVITYAGITGTPNHIVYTADGRKLTLDEAAASGEELAVGEREGKPVRTLDSVGETYTPNGGAEGVDAMPMWGRKTHTNIRSEVGEVNELQSVWAPEVFGYTGATRQPATSAVQCTGRTLQGKQVQQSHLQERGKYVRQLRAFCPLRLGKLSSQRLPESRNRPDRYEGSLRTWQHTACDQRGERPNTGYERNRQIQGAGNKRFEVCTRLCKKVWRRLGPGTNTQGAYRRANIKFSAGKKASVFGVRRGEVLYRIVREKVRRELRSVSHIKETTQRYTERGNPIVGTVAVYDIINAGSRNRFCCNGIIVSNCRVLAYAAQELPLLNIFLNKDDPYSDMASNIYGLPYDVIYREAKIERTKEGIVRRNVGKTTELGCGYGMGADKFEGQLKLDGLTEAASNAKAIVQAYRRARPSIVQFWKTCSDVLDIMLAGGKVSFGGPNNDLFLADGSSVFWGKRIPSVRLPNGTYIWYQNLRKVPRQEPAQFGDGMEFVYDQFKSNRFEVNRIYGGKLTENLIQALAFAVLKYQALQIVDMGVPVHMNVHDEWVSIVPKSMAHHAVAVHAKAMRTVPNYIPDGLLDMELDMGKNYADTTTIGGL